MSKPRILIPWYKYPPFSPDRISGISISVSELIRNLSTNDFDVDVLVAESEDALPTTSNPQGFQILYNELGRKILKGVSPDLADQHVLSEYDYIFSLHNFGARSLYPLKQRFRIVRQIHAVFRIVPIRDMVYLKHNPFDLAKAYFRKRRYEKEESLLKGTATLCVSRHLMNEMHQLGLEYPRNLFHNPIGIDRGLFFPVKLEKKFDLLFTGGFHRIKGIDILIDALCLLRGVKVKLAVIGSFNASQQKYLLRYAPQSVKENIQFMGVVPHEEMPEAINSTRFAIIPSRYESFSLFTLEALACGVPVIAANVAALPELVDPGEGILFKLSSPVDLARSIEQGLKNDESIAQVALRNGPAKAEMHDWKLVIKQMKQTLEQVF